VANTHHFTFKTEEPGCNRIQQQEKGPERGNGCALQGSIRGDGINKIPKKVKQVPKTRKPKRSDGRGRNLGKKTTTEPPELAGPPYENPDREDKDCPTQKLFQRYRKKTTSLFRWQVTFSG